MIITKVRLSRAAGTQGSLAKVLLSGASRDRNHGLVWSLFARADEATRGFLFREIEPGAFIIVAQRLPEDPHGLWTIDNPKTYAPELLVGDRLGFVLRANPAIAVRQPGKPRGLRVDAIMHAKSLMPAGERRKFSADDASRVAVAWLARRGPSIGADVDIAACSATGYSQVRIPRPSPAKAIEFSEIEFAGRLTVTDPDKLRAALFNGIGKARSYGCGLLLVRRLQD